MTDSDWEDEKPELKPSSPSSKSPKRKAEPKNSSSPGKKRKTSSSPGAEGKKVGPWSPEEDAILFAKTYEKRKNIAWQGVADAIPGRDAKSCQNRMVILNKKVQSVFG